MNQTNFWIEDFIMSMFDKLVVSGINKFSLIKQSTVAAVQEKYMKDDESFDFDDWES